MTKEELLEMVNSTICENGTREITGASLNLALTEIINAMGEGEGSGQGGVTIYSMMGAGETDEMKAHNAQVFAELKAMAEAGQTLPPIVLDVTEYYKTAQGVEIGGVTMMSFMNMMDATGAMTGGTPMLALMLAEGQLYVMEDGSTTTEAPASATAMSLKL